MKHSFPHKYSALAVALLAGIVLVGCRQEALVTTSGIGCSQVNLVADPVPVAPVSYHFDSSLVNAWGLGIDKSGNFAVAANRSGVGAFYNEWGSVTMPAIQIPSAGTGLGSPTGVVYNSSSEFLVPGTGQQSWFIYSTEDGLICAWRSGPSAVTVVAPLDAGASYTGLALATHGGKAYLYATNFGDRRIDVFDGRFQRVTSFAFDDPDLPSDYRPFGIATIDGKLWVSYAIAAPPDFRNVLPGPGNGIVDVFNAQGRLQGRFYTGGVLNAPWGMTQAPENSGGYRKVYLIGNFGDGVVNAFSSSGEHVGSLAGADGKPLVIEGLWTVSAKPEHHRDQVYFTAGPNDESDGFFGYLLTQ